MTIDVVWVAAVFPVPGHNNGDSSCLFSGRKQPVLTLYGLSTAIMRHAAFTLAQRTVEH